MYDFRLYNVDVELQYINAYLCNKTYIHICTVCENCSIKILLITIPTILCVTEL